MREFFSTHNVSFSGILWLAGVAVQISGFINPIVAYVLWGIAFGWFIWAVVSYKATRKSKKSELENLKRINDIKLDVSILIFEGTEILKGFKSVTSHNDVLPVEEFKAWREKAVELFHHYKLNDYSPLWFKDTSCVDISSPLLKDFIEACEFGLKRLEELLKGLH
jgi:hypothetical protein